MNGTVHGFTTCAACAYARQIEHQDKRGNVTQNREVVLCTVFNQPRAARMARSCGEFFRRTNKEAA